MIAEGAKLVQYDRIRDWYVADVRSLQVHAPTLLMAVPEAEWALVDMDFDAAREAMQRADDETDGRWRKSIAGMSRDDRRYRTIARLIVQA